MRIDWTVVRPHVRVGVPPEKNTEIPEQPSPSIVPSIPSPGAGLNMEASSHGHGDSQLLLHQHFGISSIEDERSRQVKSIEALEAKYGQECLFKHQFEWVAYSSGLIREEFLPIYTYRTGISVRSIWEEWVNGLDGQFSIQQLNDGWGSRWRRNVQGQKTEGSRRKHITDLITSLSQKPSWTTSLALRFLEDEYPIPGPNFLASATAFSRYLQNKATRESALKSIMEKASNYTL